MSTVVDEVVDSTAEKRALIALRRMRAKLDAIERSRVEPIAVIGMGCRFPGGANDPQTFWRLLRDGVDCISEVPPDRWDADAFYDPDPDAPGKMTTRWGGFLQDVQHFDAAFFGISAREAALMDPQQRLLLEVAFAALEDAGYPPDRIAGTRTGVFVGVCSGDYSLLQVARAGVPDPYATIGSAHSIFTGRLSYLFDLRGPSIAIDTACSSSLVAVHLACQSLRNAESTLALVGGVNVVLAPQITVSFSKGGFMAADGRCKTFDAKADGYVRAEGCGVVVLKRLANAIADGDHIYALVRGSAVNQDGRSAGLTAPSLLSQQAVLRQALENARLEPSSITYVETHGTGTALGDPIELEALTEVIGQPRPPGDANTACLLGSVKANIGHSEGAAGIAGLIKTVLALQHEEIPPQLHFSTLNPNMSLDNTPFVIPTAARPWPGPSPRFAGVSSFGFSGTNAHAVLEQAPQPTRAEAELKRSRHILTVSAKSDEALRELAGRYRDYLDAGVTEEDLADFCFTANCGRSHFRRRAATAAESLAELRSGLDAIAAAPATAEQPIQEICGPDRPQVAFLFTGQGSQYVGMGRALYETQPIFRATLARCAELLQPHLRVPLLSVLYPGPGESSPLDATEYTQPAIFALEYALATLWRSWGIQPAALLGHSVGEYVAACVAGVMSLEDGLTLIAKRARLMQSLPADGEMAVLFADRETVDKALAPHADRCAIAAVNGPENVAISGERAAVQAVVAQMEAAGYESRPLPVSHAFHSPLMDPILVPFEHAASTIPFSRASIPLVSNRTGSLFGPQDLPNAAYWRAHLRETVQFAEGMRTLWALGCRIFVEIGPHATLLRLGRQCLEPNRAVWLPSLKHDHPDWSVLLDSLAALYGHGLNIDWGGFDQGYPRRRCSLPTYPFQRKKYWLPDMATPACTGSGAPAEPRAAAESAAIPAQASAPKRTPPGPERDTQPGPRLQRIMTSQLDAIAQLMQRQLELLRG